VDIKDIIDYSIDDDVLYCHICWEITKSELRFTDIVNTDLKIVFSLFYFLHLILCFPNVDN